MKCLEFPKGLWRHRQKNDLWLMRSRIATSSETFAHAASAWTMQTNETPYTRKMPYSSIDPVVLYGGCLIRFERRIQLLKKRLGFALR